MKTNTIHNLKSYISNHEGTFALNQKECDEYFEKCHLLYKLEKGKQTQ